jgi:hypothetical protein
VYTQVKIFHVETVSRLGINSEAVLKAVVMKELEEMLG